MFMNRDAVDRLKLVLGIVVLVLIAVLTVGIAFAQDGGTSPPPAWYQKLLAFLNDPSWKVALALVGGQILRIAPWFQNKAIPMILQGVNLVLVVLGALFGVQFTPGLVTMAMPWLEPQVPTAALVLSGFGWASLLTILDGAASVALASGVQSQVKNAAQWWKLGRQVIVPPHERRR